MFRIENLSKKYGTEWVLKDVTMNIGKGMSFIIGPSGSGKTTLLNILCGMEREFEGSVSYMDNHIECFDGDFGFVWQDFHLLEDASVLENVLLPAYLKKKENKADRAEKTAEDILKQMKLADIKGKKVKSLSGGQKQRVAIARELMKNPQVIFCDEPTSALDEESAENIMDVLRSLSKKRTVIIVTHDTSLIREKDAVFQLDKGELISVPENQMERVKEDNCVKNTAEKVKKERKKAKISFKNAIRIALQNHKNRPGRFAVSVVSLVIAGTLLLTSWSGAVGKSGQAEFDKLLETYGEGIMDIGLVGNFISAAGGDENEPSADVSQDLGGLYEKYENDDRVEFIVSMQPFENIHVTLEGQAYSVEKTGNSPVLTKLLSGNIPAGEEYQVVIPLKFAESIGLTPETAIGKKIDFSATVFQWINEQPVEKPIQVQATICGVADNTVVYDYEGEQYSFTVDDSFFFNRSAIEDIRKQAGIEGENANFTIRAKTPADLISLKDELNQNGIVPLGRFELVEDIVRLDQQTAEQSGSVSVVIGILAGLLTVMVFAMTSVLRKKEYAIYKASGYGNRHLAGILAAEKIPVLIFAMLLALVINRSVMGAVIIGAVCVLAFAAELPGVYTATAFKMMKAGEKA